jgi:cobaltochelatase CobS
MPNAVSILEKLKIADLDAGTVFSGSPSGKTVRGYAKPTAFTPAVDKKYIFHEQVRDMALRRSLWNLTRSPLPVTG